MSRISEHYSLHLPCCNLINPTCQHSGNKSLHFRHTFHQDQCGNHSLSPLPQIIIIAFMNYVSIHILNVVVLEQFIVVYMQPQHSLQFQLFNPSPFPLSCYICALYLVINARVSRHFQHIN